jgi:hypothetical protein
MICPISRLPLPRLLVRAHKCNGSGCTYLSAILRPNATPDEMVSKMTPLLR